jgi:histone-lysine N-methyltransferase MLL3
MVIFTVTFFLLSDDKKQDIQAVMNRDHDNDTPDTVISSSSPECVIPEFPIRFPGMVLNLSETPLTLSVPS